MAWETRTPHMVLQSRPLIYSLEFTFSTIWRPKCSDVAKGQLSVHVAYSEPHFSIMITDVIVAFSLLLIIFIWTLSLPPFYLSPSYTLGLGSRIQSPLAVYWTCSFYIWNWVWLFSSSSTSVQVSECSFQGQSRGHSVRGHRQGGKFPESSR